LPFIVPPPATNILVSAEFAPFPNKNAPYPYCEPVKYAVSPVATDIAL